jgi:O-antigen/teichoic acid export membrane protein
MVATNFAIRACGSAASFILFALCIRYVDKSTYGELLFTLSILSSAQGLIFLGIPYLIQRNLTTSHSVRRSSALKDIFFIQLCIVTPFILFALWIFQLKLSLLIFLILLISSYHLSLKLLAWSKLPLFNATNSLLLPTLQILFLPLIVTDTSIGATKYLLIVLFTNLFLTMLFSMRSPVLQFDFKFKTIDYDTSVNLLRSSFQVGLIMFITILNTNIDVLLLGKLGGHDKLADYKVYNFSIFLLTFFSVVYSLSQANQYGSKGVDFIRKNIFSEFRKYAFLNSIYLIISSLVFLLIFVPLLTYWTDNAYSVEYRYAMLFFITGLFSSFNLFFAIALIHIDDNNSAVPYMLLSLALNVVLNLALIPKFSFVGAIVGTGISTCVMCVSNIILTYRHLRT